MGKSLAKISIIAVSLCWSALVGAVGFGDANVQSALGQPLRAEIGLVDVSDIAKKTSLTARLASADAFTAAGLEYPYSLRGLKFEIASRNGQYFIKVTTKDLVNDPFISLLIELSWPSGKLVHEYTFLLDPPDYKAAQPKAEEVKPIEPVVATPIKEAPIEAPVAPSAVTEPEVAAATANEAESAVASAPLAATEVASPATSAVEETHAVEETQAAGTTTSEVPADSAAPREGGAPAVKQKADTFHDEMRKEAPREIVVKRGDTLTSIAERLKEPDVTLEQMLVALYRANAGQFEGKNMNRIRAGKILRAPDPSDYEHLSQRAAVNEIHIHTENWNAYRQKLAAVSMPVLDQAPKQETSGKISTVVADQAPATQQSAKEVLKLSKGEAPGDKMSAVGKAPSAQEKAIAKQEEAIAKDKTQQESEQRAAMLEQQIQEQKKLVELKGQAAAVSSVTVTAPIAASGVAAASGVSAAKPKVSLTPMPTEQEESIVDSILGMVGGIVSGLGVGDMLDDPMVLGGGAVLVIAIIGGVVFMRRRNQGGGRVIKKKKMSPNPNPSKPKINLNNLIQNLLSKLKKK